MIMYTESQKHADSASMKEIEDITTAIPSDAEFAERMDRLATARRMRDRKKEPVTYEFTNDPALLHQYFLIREVMYHRRQFNQQKSLAIQDEHDKISHILIARVGNVCVGGCRLTVREGDEDFPLPLESDGTNLRETFSQLSLRDSRHAELSRFAVFERYSENEILLGLSKHMYEKVKSLRIRYVFAHAKLDLAVNWIRVAKRFGVKSVRLCEEVNLPEHPIFPGIKFYLSVAEMPDTAPAHQLEKLGTSVTPIEA